MTSGRVERALLLVDIQNDFLPGGALAVDDGDAVIPVANELARRLPLVIATQDWHPAGHASFASSHPGRGPFDIVEVDGAEATLWPDHCVQGTDGAELAADLDQRAIAEVIRKGTDPAIDSYSGFHDNDRRASTGLAELLRERGVEEVWIVGLATDVCVEFTALDALREGFATVVVEDGCRAVEQRPGDGARALENLREHGARVVTLAEARDALAASDARGASETRGAGEERS